LAALTYDNDEYPATGPGFAPGSLGSNRLEVELALAFPVKHAIASGAAAAPVHPIGGYHHNRPGPEILRRCRVPGGVPNATDIPPASISRRKNGVEIFAPNF